MSHHVAKGEVGAHSNSQLEPHSGLRPEVGLFIEDNQHCVAVFLQLNAYFRAQVCQWHKAGAKVYCEAVQQGGCVVSTAVFFQLLAKDQAQAGSLLQSKLVLIVLGHLTAGIHFQQHRGCLVAELQDAGAIGAAAVQAVAGQVSKGLAAIHRQLRDIAAVRQASWLEAEVKQVVVQAVLIFVAIQSLAPGLQCSIGAGQHPATGGKVVHIGLIAQHAGI